MAVRGINRGKLYEGLKKDNGIFVLYVCGVGETGH